MTTPLVRNAVRARADLVRITEELATLRRSQASRSVFDGARDWPSLKLAVRAEFDLKGASDQLLTLLPQAILARSRDQVRSHPIEGLGQILAHVPGESVGDLTDAVIAEARREAAEHSEAMLAIVCTWVVLVLKRDMFLQVARAKAWRRCEPGWRPSKAAHRAIAARGGPSDAGALDKLTPEVRDADSGELLRAPVIVLPGGALMCRVRT